MATSATFYLDAPSLSSASVVYSNATLTTVAADGFYSDGTIVREQDGGVLLPQASCPSCEATQSFTIYFDVTTTPPIPLGWNTQSGACAGTGTPLTVYINGTATDLYNAVVTQAKVLYTDPAATTTPLNGSNTWYKTVSAPASGQTFQVGATGETSLWGGPC
jgi:hypothetical protein